LWRERVIKETEIIDGNPLKNQRSTLDCSVKEEEEE
jgi:hypothetical protein